MPNGLTVGLLLAYAVHSERHLQKHVCAPTPIIGAFMTVSTASSLSIRRSLSHFRFLTVPLRFVKCGFKHESRPVTPLLLA